jgi:hypothetical protein
MSNDIDSRINSIDTGRHHHIVAVRIETFTKGVVEFANAIASLVVNERHVLLHAIDAP